MPHLACGQNSSRDWRKGLSMLGEELNFKVETGTLNLVGFLGFFSQSMLGNISQNYDGIEILAGFFGYFWSCRHELNAPFLWGTYHSYIFWILVPHPLSPGVAGTEEAIGILLVSPPELGNRLKDWLMLIANIQGLLKIVNVQSHDETNMNMQAFNWFTRFVGWPPTVFWRNAKRSNRKLPEIRSP